jgi:hypothetical protein
VKITKIPHDEGGNYSIFEAPDFEYQNPIKYYSEIFRKSNFSITRDFLLAKKLPFPPEEIDAFLLKRVEREWGEYYNKLIKTDIPPNFISLLSGTSKKEQVKLLKGQSLTLEQLTAFIIKAWTDFGFTFSQYRSEYQHKGLEEDDMPRLVEIKDDKVEKIGDTSMSDGQLKHAVKHRKVIISKFLDNGESWHCLFVTFKSLRGEEKWKDGQPHYHYISDKFGHDREKVVKDLTSDKYSLGNLPHIDIIDYR